jgi:hypothetical protein
MKEVMIMRNCKDAVKRDTIYSKYGEKKVYYVPSNLVEAFSELNKSMKK